MMRTSTFRQGTSAVMPEFVLWTGALGVMGLLGAVLLRGQLTIFATLVLGGSLVLISVLNKDSASLLGLAYLIVLGDVRRMVAAVAGPPTLDPLLLIGPVLAFVIALPLFFHLRLKDSLSISMLLLLVLMILEIFNPKQGGIGVGVAGALFYVAPVLWFWIGRRYASPRVVERLLYGVIFPLAVAAAILGFAQTFIGFLPYEQSWIKVASKTYNSLYVGSSIRAFGFSVSAAEYATLLGMGAAGTAAAYFTSRRVWVFAFPVLVLAIVLASGRSLIIRLIVALGLVWIMRKGRRFKPAALARLITVTAAALVLISVAASRLAPDPTGSPAKNSAAQNALAHQANGLAHPLDERYSTVGIHSRMIQGGITQGFTNPIGQGLGSTTAAGARFSDDPNVGSSEVDVSDMFKALGFLGGFTYVYILLVAMWKALRYVEHVRLAVSLPVLAILSVTAGFWLIGGQYSVCAVTFFLLGALVHDNSRRFTGVVNGTGVYE